MRSSNNGWFRTNLGPSFAEFKLEAKSPFCWLLALLLFVGTIFLYFKIYFTLFSISEVRLGIGSGVGIALLIAVLLCSQINIPLYVVAVCHSQVRCELFPVWLLRFKNSAYRTRFKPHTFVGINVVGGLMPLILALYQFSRTPSLAILAVATIISVVSYFWVTVIPGVRIQMTSKRLWLMSLIAALSALHLVSKGSGHAVPVAFAGSVLGTLIGADLLHLKDVQPEKAIAPLCIGGAGPNDGIALCGLYSLLIAEWVPNLFTFLKL